MIITILVVLIIGYGLLEFFVTHLFIQVIKALSNIDDEHF